MWYTVIMNTIENVYNEIMESLDSVKWLTMQSGDKEPVIIRHGDDYHSSVNREMHTMTYLKSIGATDKHHNWWIPVRSLDSMRKYDKIFTLDDYDNIIAVRDMLINDGYEIRNFIYQGKTDMLGASGMQYFVPCGGRYGLDDDMMRTLIDMDDSRCAAFEIHITE